MMVTMTIPLYTKVGEEYVHLGDAEIELPLDVMACPDHKPVQHRDGKPPWCRKCGLTADGQEPVSSRGPEGATIPDATVPAPKP